MQGFLSLLYSCATTENTCYRSFLHVNTQHGPHAFLKRVRVMVLNATFNNNSVISWWRWPRAPTTLKSEGEVTSLSGADKKKVRDNKEKWWEYSEKSKYFSNCTTFHIRGALSWHSYVIIYLLCIKVYSVHVVV